MAYLERVRASGSNRYRHTREQVRMATAICAGEAVLDPHLFSAMPRRNADGPTEVDGSTTALKDAMSAFASGLYAPSYGPASVRQRFEKFDTVERSIKRWNTSVTEAYRAKIRPAAFRQIFIEGGLWHVFIDRYTTDDSLRSRLEQAPDLSAFRKDRALLSMAAKAHPFLLRTPPAQEPSHGGSHFDAARFANTVLHIGERELDLKTPDDKEQLLGNSLPWLRGLAFLEMTGVNLATTDFLCDAASGLYKKEYLTINDRQPRVGINMEAVQDRVEEALPDVDGYNHRACPVIYQTTPFNGEEIPVFSAMDETLMRIYRTTGALSLPGLRGPL